MYRALLPPTCPACGQDIPRAAAHRCPICLTPFSGSLNRTMRPTGIGVAQEQQKRDAK